jgi:hypothetical protein
MSSKTFKIGEYATGGVITVIATEKKVTIVAKEWDYSKGSKKSSDQSGAKEFHRIEVQTNIRNTDRELENFLLNITTSFYTDQVMSWVKTKTKFTTPW